MTRAALLLLGLVGLSGVLSPHARADDVPFLVSDGRVAMGTLLEITLEGGDRGAAEREIARLFDEALRLERIFSNYDAASDLSRLNRAAGGGPQAVPGELVEILALSKAWTRRTSGAFDVTVGPLVEVWAAAARADRAPSADALEAARARVGAGALRLSRDVGTAELARAGMSIDLGGIAKGWAVDRMAEAVRAAGVPGALLSFGQSSLVGIGAPPDAPGWRVLVRDAAGGFDGIATLRDCALSVSASLGRSRQIGGRRYGHVLDPRSGRPLTQQRQAVVTAKSAAAAEALSTALLILDAREGIELLDALPDVEGRLVEADGARLESAGFREAVAFEPLASESAASL